MKSRPETLREQHRDFVCSTEAIRQVADSVGEIPLAELRERICEIYECLLRRLIPHAMAEDQFPLAQVTGWVNRGSSSSDAVTREHLEIARLINELDALRWELAYPLITSMQEQALRRVLYGLYALFCVHVVDGEYRCVCDPRGEAGVVDVVENRTWPAGRLAR
jgi:hypothetical protein